MRYFNVFTKKEFTGAVRSPKLWIIIGVFALFGLMNPVFAKFTPEILGMFMDEATIASMGYSTPTALDSWAQFFKNAGQLGLILFIILFGSSLTSEFAHGTLTAGLTRGLPRGTVVVVKYITGMAVLTAAMLLSFVITLAGTAILFELENVGYILYATFTMWLYCAMLLSLSYLGGVLTGNTAGALIIPGVAFVVFSMFSVVPEFAVYTPQYLMDCVLPLGARAVKLTKTLLPVGEAVAIITAALTASVAVFKKKNI